VRHIVATLVLPDSNGANESLYLLVEQGFNVRLSEVANAILPSIMFNVPSDIAEAWQSLFEKPPPTPSVDAGTISSDGPSASETPDKANFSVKVAAAAETKPSPTSPAFPVITLSGFTSDALGAGYADPLGINPDVRAFARLICLEQATPPLSICLFGEWGPGKSTFMERMQREIALLTQLRPFASAAHAPTYAADEPKFVENVVQIKFNAWHFADASLWASLTAVFFDQLRRGGYGGGQAADYKALISKVADRVRSLEADATNAMTKVEDAKRKSDTANKALDTAEKQLAANDLTLAWTQLQDDFEEIRKNNQAKLKEIGRRAYRDDLATDTKAFSAAVVEASSLPGRMALIGRTLIGGGWPTRLGVLAIAMVAGFGVALPAIDPTDATTWFQRFAAWGAGSFAAIGALWKAFSEVKPILDGAWKYAKAVEDARAKLTAEVEEKRKLARDAASELKAAEDKLETARKPLSVYRDGKPADSPSTVLRYFLFEDGDIRDYDKQVSIVSRARRSFEQLDSIVAKTRTDRKAAEEKRARGETLTDEEKSRLEPTNGQQLLVPDRIVLYIDDLDRCTHDQVYAVLQAIHLLLAFELFVVVVGVDVRWIEGAVAKHFEGDLVQADDADRRRRHAIDYLEKIFQIPFWLRRLNTGTATTAGGGTYGAYVRELLKENERAAPLPSVFKSLRAESHASDEAAAPSDGSGEPDASQAMPDIELPPAEDEFGAISAALASLKLERGEIDLLSSPEIGMIASKSPRAVKRLINVYRIVRARLDDRQLDSFLGKSGSAPRYPIAALLAAIETGQPIEVAEAFYPALALLPADKRLNLLWAATDRTTAEGLGNASGYLLTAKQASPMLGTSLTAIDALCGPLGATVGAYREMADLVRRYSFNRYC
jgi:hypothetical protein